MGGGPESPGEEGSRRQSLARPPPSPGPREGDTSDVHVRDAQGQSRLGAERPEGATPSRSSHSGPVALSGDLLLGRVGE